MSSGKTEKIYGINGPVIYLKGKTDFKMSEMVHVGEEKLVGEVISLDKDRTTLWMPRWLWKTGSTRKPATNSTLW